MHTKASMIAVSLLSLSVSACALPDSGDHPAVNVTVSGSDSHISVGRPNLQPSSTGYRIHGSVCRHGRLRQLSRIEVVVKQINTDGRTVASKQVLLAGMSGIHSRNCAYYNLNIDRRLAQGDTIQVCSGQTRGSRCNSGVDTKVGPNQDPS
jgi:hypothetical protein